MSPPLTVRRTFACPPAELFAAWTDPAALTRWWGGGLARTLSAAVDLRPGGAFRLTMRAGERVFALEGTYREVRPPRRLVYTWRWDGLAEGGGDESLVAVDFLDRGGATEVVVTHAGLAPGAVLAFHGTGWDASLERLAALVAAPEPAA